MTTAPLACLALTACILVAPCASRAEPPRVDVQRFEASPHAGDLPSVRTASSTRYGFGGGVLFSYAKAPLRILDRRTGLDETFRLVDTHAVADLFASFGAWRRLSVGVNVPVVMVAAGESGTVVAPAADSAGLGDIRLGVRVVILKRDGQGFGLGIDVDGSFPTATEGTYAGHLGLTLTPRLVVDYRVADTLLALNAGYRIQEAEELAGEELGGGLLLGFGVAHSLLDERLQLLLELHMGTRQQDWFGGNTTTLEGQVGANVCVGGWARVYLAAGAGFLSGVGEPTVRITSGVRIERCVAERPAPPARLTPPPEPPEPKMLPRRPSNPPEPVAQRPPEPTPEPRPPELLALAQQIEFATSRATLRPASEKVLDAVARWILAHPGVTMIVVEGHTDNQGDPRRNLKLSSDRAKTVVAYLIARGVLAGRLRSRGFGAAQPIGDNATPAGRQANRRVVFEVLQGGTP